MNGIYNYQQEGLLGSYQQVVLMSQSPRRRDLLSFLAPQVQAPEVDERRIEEETMARYVEDPYLIRVAKTGCEIAKAKLPKTLEDQTLYIAADTLVVHQDQIYHKPQDLEEAEAMIRSYLGKTHQVVTSVCLATKKGLDIFYSVASVNFVAHDPALDPLIQAYLLSGSPLDKAGAYGIQDIDPRLIASIQGDLYTIIGLPVAELHRRLEYPSSMPLKFT